MAIGNTNSGSKSNSSENISIINQMTVGFGDIIPMFAKQNLTAKDGTKFALQIQGTYGQTGGIVMISTNTYDLNKTAVQLNTLPNSGLIGISESNQGIFNFSTTRWLKFIDSDGNARYGLHSASTNTNPNIKLSFYQIMKNIGETSLATGDKYYIDFNVFYFDLSTNEYKTQNQICQSSTSGGTTISAGNFCGHSMDIALNTNMILLGLEVNSIRFFKYNTGHTGYDCPDYIDLTLEYPYEE